MAPFKFKQTIGEFQPRFSGYQQHDSSELLSFLLDGLHEDLNRVKSKPATQAVDSNGRPDAIVAQESWERHQLRNQSVIVDKFQGQLKSKVVCPDCGKTSVTFDPFMFLSVPLPQGSSEKLQKVTLVRAPGHKTPPTLYGVPVSAGMKAAELKARMCELVRDGPSLDSARLCVWELCSGKLYKEFKDTDPVDHILVRDEIKVFEMSVLDPAGAEPGPGLFLPALDGALHEDSHHERKRIVIQNVRLSSSTYAYSSYIYKTEEKFGDPVIVEVPANSIRKPHTLLSPLSHSAPLTPLYTSSHFTTSDNRPENSWHCVPYRVLSLTNTHVLY